MSIIIKTWSEVQLQEVLLQGQITRELEGSLGMPTVVKRNTITQNIVLEEEYVEEKLIGILTTDEFYPDFYSQQFYLSAKHKSSCGFIFVLKLKTALEILRTFQVSY